MASTPFGGDDTGFVPPDPATARCECAVDKNVGKLVARILRCHRDLVSRKFFFVNCHCGRAIRRFADDNAEDPCEGTAITKFLRTGTTGCDPCTTSQTITTTCAEHPTATGLQGLANFVACQLDGAASLVYCASPSGAFLN